MIFEGAHKGCPYETQKAGTLTDSGFSIKY
jgi:hypothetical protein